MASIYVFIIDDQEIVRGGVHRLLQLEPSIEVVGEAASGEEALDRIGSARPDVILLDIKMPGQDGISLISPLKAIVSTAKILILSVYTDSYVSAAIGAGANGYLAKDISGPELIRAIHAAAHGKSPIHLSVAAEELSHLIGGVNHSPKSMLTARQLDILRYVAQGASNPQIAQCLFLSERTVKRELSAIFAALGVTNRAEAIGYVYEHRLI